MGLGVGNRRRDKRRISYYRSILLQYDTFMHAEAKRGDIGGSKDRDVSM